MKKISGAKPYFFRYFFQSFVSLILNNSGIRFFICIFINYIIIKLFNVFIFSDKYNFKKYLLSLYIIWFMIHL